MKDFIKSDRGKCLYWIIGIIVVLLFAIVLIPQPFSLINRVEPIILGFPFSVLSFFVIALVQGGLLSLLYYIQKVRGEL